MSEVEKRTLLSVSLASFGSAGSSSDAYINAINELQRKRGKPELSSDDVIVRKMRMTGTKITSIFTKFEREDLERMREQVPGMALLIGHNYEMAPVGTFFAAEVVKDGDDYWLDGWFYVLNDDEGRRLVEKIDKGIYNEASISWLYDKAICSICGGDYMGFEPNEDGEYCTHMRGFKYGGKLCYIHTTGDVRITEASIVYKGAHPGTLVGIAAEAAAERYGAMLLEGIDAKKRGGKHMKKQEKAYVPNNPPGYGLDNRSDWEAPTLSQFLDALDLPRDTRWMDLSKEYRRWIASHYAWAPSDDPDDYTFSDLKLPHHIPTERYPNSVVKWGGVRAAAQRLPMTDIPEDEVKSVQDHLAKHYHEFGRRAPWESDASSWERYVSLVRVLARGFVDQETLDEVALLAKRLFADDGGEVMELSVRIGEEVVVVSGDKEKIESELNERLSEFVSKMQEKLSELEEVAKLVDDLEKKLADVEKKAKLGEQYVNDLVEEVKRLFVAAEGAEAIEGYGKMVEAMAERGEIEALKAERDRLAKKLGELPNERLSRDVEDGPINDIPPRIDAFKQR